MDRGGEGRGEAVGGEGGFDQGVPAEGEALAGDGGLFDQGGGIEEEVAVAGGAFDAVGGEPALPGEPGAGRAAFEVEQAQAGEVGRGVGGWLGCEEAGAGDGEDGFAEQQGAVVAGPGAVAEEDGDVGGFGGGVGRGLGGGDADFDFGDGFGEGGEVGDQPVSGEAVVGGDVNQAAGGAGGDFGGDGGLGALDGGAAEACGFVEGDAFGGEGDAAVPAVEQLAVQFGFEPGDVMADGGLGGAEFAGGAAEVEVAGGGLEHGEGGQGQAPAGPPDAGMCAADFRGGAVGGFSHGRH